MPTSMIRSVISRAALLAAALLLLPSLQGCSLKEDRTECPCWLDVVVSGCGAVAEQVNVAGWGAERLFGEGVRVADYPEGYEQTVPKGIIRLGAWCGLGDGEEAGGELRLRDGVPCPPLWSYASTVDCTGETARDTIRLVRQYTGVHVRIENLAEGEEYPYTLAVKSPSGGISLLDGKPLARQWGVGVDRASDGTFSFRVPRQGDGGLLLDIFLEGDYQDSYPIGEHILRAGYDWDAADLPEIWIGMDYGGTEPVIRIDHWNEGAVYEAVI